jgi:hypothetical protein
MSGADRIIRWSTALAVLGVILVAAVAPRPGHRVDARGQRRLRPGHGLIGTVVAAWPAVALVGSYELLMMVIRNVQISAERTSESERDADPPQEQAAQVKLKVARFHGLHLMQGPGALPCLQGKACR